MSIKNLVSSTTVDINCDELIYDNKNITNISTDTLTVNSLTFTSTIDGYIESNLNSGVSAGTFLVPPTVTARLKRFGDKVFIQFDDFSGTTNSPNPNETFSTTTQIDADFRPTAEVYVPCIFTMDGDNLEGIVEINNTGFIQFISLGNIDPSIIFSLNKIAFTYTVN